MSSGQGQQGGPGNGASAVMAGTPGPGQAQPGSNFATPGFAGQRGGQPGMMQSGGGFQQGTPGAVGQAPGIMGTPGSMPHRMQSGGGGGVGNGANGMGVNDSVKHHGINHGGSIMSMEGGGGGNGGLGNVFHAGRGEKPPPFWVGTGAIFGATFFLMLILWSISQILLVLGMCAYGVFLSYWLKCWMFQRDDGTPEMRQVSEPIRLGSIGFLTTQYGTIIQFAGGIAVVISYQLRPTRLVYSVYISTCIRLCVYLSVSLSVCLFFPPSLTRVLPLSLSPSLSRVIFSLLPPTIDNDVVAPHISAATAPAAWRASETSSSASSAQPRLRWALSAQGKLADT